ncbi:MAG: hypothetical protein AAB624_02125 [Patescibacteria group bacterium]
MTRVTTQNIPNATVTKIAFDTEEYDVGDIADATTNDRFNIKKAGKYLIDANLCSPNTDLGESVYAMIYKNGAEAANNLAFGAATDQSACAALSTTFDLAVNDYIELYIYQNEGAAQNTNTGAYKPTMSVVQLDTSGNATTLQGAYDMGRLISTTDARDITITLADTTTDSNLIVNVASGSTSKFAVQYNSADTFSISNAASAQGSALFKNATDNTTAFQIQNSTGTPLVTVDTTNKKLTVATDIVATSAATATTGTTEATARTNVTTVTLTAAGSFANNDVIFLNNAGQDYYTRIVSGGGTTTLTVSPAVSYDVSTAVTKYTVQNIGATTVDYATNANKFFQGYFLGGVVTGAGSTTLSDGNLSSTGNLILQSTSGNVGIGSGTTAPTQKLVVQGVSGGTGFGGTDRTGGIRVRYSSGYGVGLDVWDNGLPRWGIVRYGANDTGTVIMEGAYNSTDVIFNAGNVGIGTTAPGERLTLNAASGNNIIQFQTNGTTRGYLGVSNSTNGVINGSVIGDLMLRTQATNFRVSVDSGSTSALTINTSGDVMLSGDLGRNSHSSGGFVGGYNNIASNDTKSNPIYVIGSSYQPTDTALSNMYGIGYSHSNFWGAGKASGWGLYTAEAGVVHNVLSDSGIWTSGTITSTKSATMTPRWDNAFYVLQSQHWYGQDSTQDMYVGESNIVNVRGSLRFMKAANQCLGRGSSDDTWLRLSTNCGADAYTDLAIDNLWAAGGLRFDIAEYTPVKETDNLVPGDIVSSDPDADTQLRRSQVAYDHTVFGIVSSIHSAAMVIGGKGPELYANDRSSLPIALGGRVLVKVSSENGLIERGDAITTSSIAGTGMKITQSGPIIGKSMDRFDPSQLTCIPTASAAGAPWREFEDPGINPNGIPKNECFVLPDGTYLSRITVFVTPSWYSPNQELLAELNVSGLATLSTLTVTGASTFEGSVTVVGDAEFQGNLKVLGDTEVANITVNGKIITAGDTPTIVLGATTTGDGSSYTIEGNDIAGSITITTGTATIDNPLAAGEQAVMTFITPFTTTPRITLTPTTEAAANIKYFITKSGTEFKLHFTEAPLPNSIYSFDYQILQ